MARASKPLTKRMVDGMKPGEALWDAEVRGFGVRCQRRDKVFVFKYQRDGKPRWVTIGFYGSRWTPEAARERAKVLAGVVAEGAVPAAERAADRAAITVSELCRLYTEAAEKGLILGKKNRPKKSSTLAT